jgi:hypothetical protein
MHKTGSDNEGIWIRSVCSRYKLPETNLQSVVNSEYFTSITSNCECMYDAFSQDCNDSAQSRYRFFVSIKTKAGETAVIWTKDVSIKNGEPPAVRKEFLARIVSFKAEVLDEVFRILEEKRGPARLDFYTELDKIKF